MNHSLHGETSDPAAALGWIWDGPPLGPLSILVICVDPTSERVGRLWSNSPYREKVFTETKPIEK